MADASRIRVVHHPAQDLDQRHLEQAVGQQPGTAALAIGLGEQQVQGVIQFADRRQRHHYHRWQRLHDRIARAAIEVQRGAGEIRAIQRCVEEHMVQRLRIQQQAGCVDLQPGQRDIAPGMTDLHFTLAQDVQEGTTRLRLEDVAPAQRTAVEQRGLHPEAFQQGGEAVGCGSVGGYVHG